MHAACLRRTIAALLLAATPVAAKPSVVAAENVYGSVATDIAGPDAQVTSILSNPNQDPHLFEASPSVARALAGAQIVVANGIGYDPWMDPLLAASPVPGRTVLVAGGLMGRAQGDNPHLWYDPATMPVMAQALGRALSAADPAHAAGYDRRLRAVLDGLASVAARAAALRTRLAGTPVTATEPVFGPMAAAIGLDMRNERFQRAVMNDTEPAAADVAAFEADLRQHRVRLLIYNSQVSSPLTKRLLRLAHDAGIPVIGVTETEPPGISFPRWMLSQLDALEAALPPR